MVELYTGTRIYYGGDMANLEGFGTITAIEKNRWGVQIKIAMDDGRKINIPPCLFSPEYLGHGGTRFVTEAAYNDYRQKQFASFRNFAAKNAV